MILYTIIKYRSNNKAIPINKAMPMKTDLIVILIFHSAKSKFLTYKYTKATKSNTS
ncbi:hypothetical protein GUT189_13910 [Streptococcus ruminantium]|nr:hypothetical protein GUT189_13910 [Streptococcus ruminantium]